MSNESLRSNEPSKSDESQLKRVLHPKSRWGVEEWCRIIQTLIMVLGALGAILFYVAHDRKTEQLEDQLRESRLKLQDSQRRGIVDRNLQWDHDLTINPEPEVQERGLRLYVASYSMHLKNRGEVPVKIEKIGLSIHLGTLQEEVMDEPGAFRINTPIDKEEGIVRWRQVLNGIGPGERELGPEETLSFTYEYGVLVDRESFVAIKADISVIVEDEQSKSEGVRWTGLDQLPRNKEDKSNNFRHERVDEAIPPENGGA